MLPTAPLVYPSSKVRFAPLWRELRDTGRLPIQATWIDVDEVSDWPKLMEACVAEAGGARWVLAYAEEGDHWNGALAEIGAGLVGGATVVYVGPENGPTGRENILRHPRVLQVESLEAAIIGIRASLIWEGYL